MKVASLALMTRRRQTLLGLKRGGPEIGQGTYNGPDGKQEKGETILECLYREVWEEIRVRIVRRSAKKVAIITFFAAGVPDFEVHIYRVPCWKGRPRQTESMMTPGLHNTNRLPLRRMLASDRTWFKRAARGERFCANVFYRKRAKCFLGIQFLPFVDHE